MAFDSFAGAHPHGGVRRRTDGAHRLQDRQGGHRRGEGEKVVMVAGISVKVFNATCIFARPFTTSKPSALYKRKQAFLTK